MASEYLAHSLLSNYANATDVRSHVDKYDFYIFPIVNPDGFAYTQSTTRLWRKNRQPNYGSHCVGIDINRNWDVHWSDSNGASTDPCAEDYRGPSAGSTPEIKALSRFQNFVARAQGVRLYIDIHSYSQLWMSPYGYNCSVLPKDNRELLRVSAGAVKALKGVYGTDFTYGPICETIYPATGGSVDYAYDVTKAKYSFATELRDTGMYGFILPGGFKEVEELCRKCILTGRQQAKSTRADRSCGRRLNTYCRR